LLLEVAVTGKLHHPLAKEVDGKMMEIAATSTTVARMTGLGGPKNLIPGMLQMSSTFDKERIKKETSEILADPERMELVRIMEKLSAEMPMYPRGYEAMKREITLY